MPASLAIRILFWAWFLAAVAVGHYQLLQRFTYSTLPGLLLSLSALLVLAYRRLGVFRRWVDGVDGRGLVLLHATRFVGLWFVLPHRTALPPLFAFSGAITEGVVALAALLIVFLPLSDQRRWRAIYIWNVVGMIDLALVLFGALRLALTDARVFAPFMGLPLSLLPTFLLPLLIASHLALWVRLARRQP